LNSLKWMLWNDGVDMAEFGMTRVQIGLFQHALAHPEANGERFESIEEVQRPEGKEAALRVGLVQMAEFGTLPARATVPITGEAMRRSPQ
jgi:hypothetical protein